MAYRPQPAEADVPNWTVRVVPNKFPALQVEGDLGREGLGLYDRMNGIGAHEVIIETPGHKDSLADMPTRCIEDVLWAYRDPRHRSETGPPPAVHSDLQESRRCSGRHARAQPLAVDCAAGDSDQCHE